MNRLPNISCSDKSDALDDLADFISDADNQYGTGMAKSAIAFVNRQKAINGKCSFVDPYFINGNISTLNSELAGQNHPYLLTSSIDVYGDDNLAPSEAHNNLFSNTLKALNSNECCKDFNKVIIPIGCNEQGVVGHNICVVMENIGTTTAKATILDQMGQGYYTKTKLKILDDLADIGFGDIDFNRMPISPNRSDCASLTSLLVGLSLDGQDMRDFKDLSDNYCSTNNRAIISTQDVDEIHKEDKLIAQNASLVVAKDLIKEAYNVGSIDALRGLSDVPEPSDIVASRIMKYSNAKNQNQTNRTNSGFGRY